MSRESDRLKHAMQLALSNLIWADAKDADDAPCSASEHRREARIVLSMFVNEPTSYLGPINILRKQVWAKMHEEVEAASQ